MVHGGVGADGQPEDAPGIDPGGLAQVPDDGGEGLLDNGVLELLLAPGLALLDDPVNDIGAVADLAVAGGTLGKDFAADKVRQHHGHRGGADIDGAARDGGFLRGAQLHAPEALPAQLALDAEGKIVFPEGGGKLYHNLVGNLHGLYPGFRLNGPGEALVVGHGVVQAGLVHGEHQAAEAVLEGNAAFLKLTLTGFKNGDLLGGGKVRGFHSGLVGAGNIGDKDGAVVGDLAAAAEPPARFIFLVGNVPGPEGIQGSGNQLHPAFAAGAVAGAGGVDGDVGPPCQLQKIASHAALHRNLGGTLNLKDNLWHIKTCFLPFLLPVYHRNAVLSRGIGIFLSDKRAPGHIMRASVFLRCTANWNLAASPN